MWPVNYKIMSQSKPIGIKDGMELIFGTDDLQDPFQLRPF